MILIIRVPDNDNYYRCIIESYGREALNRIHHTRKSANEMRVKFLQAIAYDQGFRQDCRIDPIITIRKVYTMADARNLIRLWYENA